MSATQDEVNKQRAALLTAVAQQGTAGKTAYEAEAARQAEYAKTAAAAVAADDLDGRGGVGRLRRSQWHGKGAGHNDAIGVTKDCFKSCNR